MSSDVSESFDIHGEQKRIIVYNFLWRLEVITSSLRNKYVSEYSKIYVPTNL